MTTAFGRHMRLLRNSNEEESQTSEAVVIARRFTYAFEGMFASLYRVFFTVSHLLDCPVGVLLDSSS